MGFVLLLSVPVADLAGMRPIAGLDRSGVHIAGVALVVLGIVVSMVGQAAMGESWRGDVDPDARTPLVTTGPFTVVRNPIFTGIALTTPDDLAPAVGAITMRVGTVRTVQPTTAMGTQP